MLFVKSTLAIGLALTVAFLLTSPVHSQNIKTPYLRGAGSMSCAKWEDQKETVPSDEAEWLLGYITAYNRFSFRGASGDLGDGTDAKALVAYVDKYCGEHPLDWVETAAYRLVIELMARDVIAHPDTPNSGK